jgi:hypothetical protein
MTDTNSPKNVASAADVETDSMTGAGNRSSGPTPHRAAYGSGSRPNWRSTLRLTVGLTLNAPAHICRSVPRRRAPNARTERRQMSPPGAPDRHFGCALDPAFEVIGSPPGRGASDSCYVEQRIGPWRDRERDGHRFLPARRQATGEVKESEGASDCKELSLVSQRRGRVVGSFRERTRPAPWAERQREEKKLGQQPPAALGQGKYDPRTAAPGGESSRAQENPGSRSPRGTHRLLVLYASVRLGVNPRADPLPETEAPAGRRARIDPLRWRASP